MLGNLNRNDVAFIKRQMASLDVFKKKLEKDKEKAEAIDAKYKALADKAKQSVNASMEDWQKKIEFVSSSTMSLYGKSVEDLMEMILTEEEPPLIIHNKETDEEEINPNAVAPAEEVIDEDVEDEKSEEVSEFPEPDEIEPEADDSDSAAEDNEDLEDMPDFEEEDSEEDEYEDDYDEEKEAVDPEDGDWPTEDDFPDEWK